MYQFSSSSYSSSFSSSSSSSSSSSPPPPSFSFSFLFFFFFFFFFSFFFFFFFFFYTQSEVDLRFLNNFCLFIFFRNIFLQSLNLLFLIPVQTYSHPLYTYLGLFLVLKPTDWLMKVCLAFLLPSIWLMCPVELLLSLLWGWQSYVQILIDNL